MAVAHCMDGVLALSVVLAEDFVSQTASFGKRAWIRRVAEVHHLIDGEQCLVATLLSIS